MSTRSSSASVAASCSGASLRISPSSVGVRPECVTSRHVKTSRTSVASPTAFSMLDSTTLHSSSQSAARTRSISASLDASRLNRCSSISSSRMEKKSGLAVCGELRMRSRSSSDHGCRVRSAKSAIIAIFSCGISAETSSVRNGWVRPCVSALIVLPGAHDASTAISLVGSSTLSHLLGSPPFSASSISNASMPSSTRMTLAPRLQAASSHMCTLRTSDMNSAGTSPGRSNERLSSSARRRSMLVSERAELLAPTKWLKTKCRLQTSMWRTIHSARMADLPLSAEPVTTMDCVAARTDGDCGAADGSVHSCWSSRS
eukprot:Unigene8047_Nuclearia_a/m.24685 Unigene8047_Nuclearia_a/g.24685  ORF Unigene8047_Nuclearia_a/g.24685 Unigene8047_Nuclearia_a/m.24685 type:complete len:316 (-) Unigene8047_Nuclearia_a:824-1771(-)